MCLNFMVAKTTGLLNCSDVTKDSKTVMICPEGEISRFYSLSSSDAGAGSYPPIITIVKAEILEFQSAFYPRNETK